MFHRSGALARACSSGAGPLWTLGRAAIPSIPRGLRLLSDKTPKTSVGKPWQPPRPARPRRGPSRKPAARQPAARVGGSSAKDQATTSSSGLATPSAKGDGANVADALSWGDVAMRLGMWTVVSLNVGAFFSQGDEGVQVMLHLDEFVDPVLQPGQTRTVLVSRLERLVRGAAQNDTLKLLLLRSPGFVERLLELLEAPQDARGSRFGVSATVRNHAAKVIEHIVASPEAQIEFVDRRFHLRILSLMEDAHTAFYVKKTLATALVALGSQQANLPELSQAGLVSTLHREQELEGLRRWTPNPPHPLTTPPIL